MSSHIRSGGQDRDVARSTSAAGTLPLTRLVAQWRRCGGDRCRVRNYKRCRRGAQFSLRREGGQVQ
jgi:hypothetical protein